MISDTKTAFLQQESNHQGLQTYLTLDTVLLRGEKLGLQPRNIRWPL